MAPLEAAIATAWRAARQAARFKVFVYGTLLSGEPNHGLLERARPLGSARTVPHFELRDLGAFPAMLARGRTAVAGELFDVDLATLAVLDRLEGHPEFYRRTVVELEGGARAFAYLLASEQGRGTPRMTNGDWRRRKEVHHATQAQG